MTVTTRIYFAKVSRNCKFRRDHGVVGSSPARDVLLFFLLARVIKTNKMLVNTSDAGYNAVVRLKFSKAAKLRAIVIALSMKVITVSS